MASHGSRFVNPRAKEASQGGGEGLWVEAWEMRAHRYTVRFPNLCTINLRIVDIQTCLLWLAI